MNFAEVDGIVRPPDQAPNQADDKPSLQSYGLDALFTPASVAVIGATPRPGTVGYSVLQNLLGGKHPVKVYAVNAKHPEVLGLKSYASIRDVPGPVDLAMVATRSQITREF